MTLFAFLTNAIVAPIHAEAMPVLTQHSTAMLLRNPLHRHHPAKRSWSSSGRTAIATAVR